MAEKENSYERRVGNAIYAAVMEVAFDDKTSQEQLDAKRNRIFHEELERSEQKSANSVAKQFGAGMARGVQQNAQRPYTQKEVPNVQLDTVDGDLGMEY